MLDRTRPPHVYPIEGLRLPEVEKDVFPNNTELYEINGGSQDVNQLMLIFDGGKADCRVGVTAQLAAEQPVVATFKGESVTPVGVHFL